MENDKTSAENISEGLRALSNPKPTDFNTVTISSAAAATVVELDDKIKELVNQRKEAIENGKIV